MAIVATTKTMKATGTRPIVEVMISVTSPLISPPGTSRRTKAKPCRAMNIASVAATGVNLRNWISDPLISPTPKATTAISDEPEDHHRSGAAVVDEERADDHEQSGERSDGQVDAAEQHGDRLADER